MGVIKDILGLGTTVGRVAEVFIPNKTKAQTQEHLRSMGAQAQFGAEFQHARTGRFDRFVDGLNRLPRPVMALGTVGLFVFAMIDPARFATRMQGLDYVPDPLWWLLGAVVSFYFGAREMHHFRHRKAMPKPVTQARTMSEVTPVKPASKYSGNNAALADWYDTQNKGG